MELKRRRAGIPLALKAAAHREQPSAQASVEQLDYLVDMILELNQMSAKAGWTMLAAALGLAHFAASQQRNSIHGVKRRV